MVPASIRAIKETGKGHGERYDLALMRSYKTIATMAMQVVAIAVVGAFPDLVRLIADPGKIAFGLPFSLLATAITGVWIVLKAKSHDRALVRNNQRLPQRHHLPSPDALKRHLVGRWWLVLRDRAVSVLGRIPVRPILI